MTLAWGGHRNGKIPDAALMRVPWQPYHLLRADACAALVEVNRRYRMEFGVDIWLTDAYREAEIQERIFRERYVQGIPQGTGDARWWLGGWWYRRQGTASAAVPPTSNHGWAVAADFGGGINIEGSRQHAWMRKNADELGWIHPPWAHDNIPSNGSEEPWHFEFPRPYTGTPSAPASEEDEDVVTSQDRQEIAGAVLALLAPHINGIATQATEANQNAWAVRRDGMPLMREGTAAAQVAADAAQETREQLAAALSVAHETLDVATAVLALVRDDAGAALLLERVENLRARMPRSSSAQYGKPGVATYAELAVRAEEGGVTYQHLSGALEGASVAIDSEQMRDIVDGVTAGVQLVPEAIAATLGERLSRALP